MISIGRRDDNWPHLAFLENLRRFATNVLRASGHHRRAAGRDELPATDSPSHKPPLSYFHSINRNVPVHCTRLARAWVINSHSSSISSPAASDSFSSTLAG